jgi:peroxiredoxin-like protein
MHPFPHRYRTTARAQSEGDVTISGAGLPDISSAPPAEFGGPGDQWSPESLLVAAVADCFILSFRAIARASKLEWTALECEVSGTLDRPDRVTQFTQMDVSAALTVPPGTDVEKAEKLLHKAEQSCLISNSLKAERALETAVTVAG